MKKATKLSILGDSISTYIGISNSYEACKETYTNACFYRPPFPVEKTYWHIVMDTLGLSLCVNNSYSGGNLSGRSDPTAGVNRAHHLSRDNGEAPDLIILFMGINDLGRGLDAEVFVADYRETLSIIRKSHPDATLLCVNLPDRDPRLKERTIHFNSAIAAAVTEAGDGVMLADLFNSRLNNDFYYINTLDGLHPDEDGMRIIAEVIIEALES